MKLKFFSMMAAACVALFSVSSLTCCSGGGGGGGEGGSDNTLGYLTYDGFTKQMHGIRIEASTTYLTIKPTAPVDDYAPNQNDLPDSAGRRMYVSLSNATGTLTTNAIATYIITSYQDEEGIERPTGTLPYAANMTITLGDAGSASNGQILAALFFASQNESFTLTDNVDLELRFTGNGGTVAFSSKGRHFSSIDVTVDIPVSGYGPFAVVR